MTSRLGRRSREIHLGDLVRALSVLDCQDPERAAAIAACLGFGLRPAADGDTTPSHLPHRVFDPTARPVAEPQPSRHQSMPPRAPQPATRPHLPESVQESRLEDLPHLAPPAWPPPVRPGGADNPFSVEPEPPLARARLLPEPGARHVLSAALGTRRVGSEPDLPALIEALCQRRVLTRLPRRGESTVAAGCQLLLDYSASMTPFWQDLQDLDGQVRDVLGRHAVTTYGFDGDPGSSERWTPAGPEPWAPDGRPVLAASDLGTRATATMGPREGWDAVARRCAESASPLLVLIPLSPGHWPRRFPANATLIHWAPRTTAGMVRRRGAGASPPR